VSTTFTAEDTVVIFDWDDTILPSSWILNQKLRLDQNSELTSHQKQQLAEVASITIELLCLAKAHGHVVIITTAKRGWIELTCRKFLPTLFPVLESIRVVSARSNYETAEMTSPFDWKLQAFENVIRRIYGPSASEAGRSKNVISFGDSSLEREALMRSTASLPNCCSKSVKFTSKPDIDLIQQQQCIVRDSFEEIVQHDGNLDLCLTVQ